MINKKQIVLLGVILILAVTGLILGLSLTSQSMSEERCNSEETIVSNEQPTNRGQFSSFESWGNSSLRDKVASAEINTDIKEDLREIALRRFGYCGNDEGIVPDKITIFPISSTEIVIILLTTRLPDDSIASVETRVDFLQKEGDWLIAWIGFRWSCKPGRGHRNLRAEPCY